MRAFIPGFFVGNVAFLIFLLGSCSPSIPTPHSKDFFCEKHTQCPAGSQCINHICVSVSKSQKDGGEQFQPPEKKEGISPERHQESSGENAPDSLLPDPPLPEEATGDQPPTEPSPEGTCSPGQTRPCYSGPAGTQGVGLCQEGTQTCNNNQWGECKGQILPQSETCNGQDDDCDGKTDNGLPPPPCGRQLGVCSGSVRTCKGKKGWIDCTAEEYSAYSNDYEAKEMSCDGKDNDCDGKIDPPPCSCRSGETQACYSGPAATRGVGPCKAGTQSCTGGSWGACKGEALPAVETCNGQDDDCDGHTDNQKGSNKPLSQSCSTACGAGTQSCTGGSWGACSAPQPQAETCNGQDDDCDGHTDNQKGSNKPLSQSCQGPCGAGTQTCQNGSWATCSTAGSAETCNGQDDDCDGHTDNQPGRSDPLTRTCSTRCGSGIELCQNGTWANCSAQAPQAETCNGQDDDCDGQTDEDSQGNSLSRPCYTGPSGTEGRGLCKGGTQTCSGGNWGSCAGEVTPTTEDCNGQDDDCDGRTDNNPGGQSPLTRTCSTACGTGTETCTRGQWAACTATQPNLEVCNQRDDDCDNQTDEVCFTQQTRGRHYHPAYDPAITPSGSHYPSLAYDGAQKYRRVTNGGYEWWNSHRIAGGIAVTNMAVQTRLGSYQLLGVTEISAGGDLQVNFFRQHTSEVHTHYLRLGRGQAAGDLVIAPNSSFLLTFEPNARQLIWASPIGGTQSVIQPTIRRTTLSRNGFRCTPARLALQGNNVAVSCPGFYLQSSSSSSSSRRRLPSPQQVVSLTAGALQDRVMLLSLGSGTTTIRSAPSVCPAPLDLAFAQHNSTSYLVVSCLGRVNSSGNAENPVLAVYNLSTGSTRRLTLPASSGQLTRPIGVHTTSDGLVLVTAQHFSSSSPYTIRGGHLYTFHLSELINGRNTPLQSFPIQPPEFVDATPNGRTAIVTSPDPTHASFYLYTR